MPESQPPQHDAPPTDPELFEEVDQTLRRLMPWAVSLLLHTGIVVLAMLLVWATIEPAQEQHKPVEVALSNTPPSPVDVPLRDDSQADEPDQPTQFSADALELPDPAITPIKHDFRNIGPQMPPNPRDSQSPGPGDDAGPGPGGGEILPPVQGGRIVYVIDASGSLIDSFPFIMNELRMSIAEMGHARSQTGRPYEFAVVFFRDGQVVEMGGPGTGLSRGFNPATPDRVAHALAWLSAGGSKIGPGGKTDPMPAIQQALRYDPQQVVLLSDNITGQGIHALDPDALIDAVLDARGRQNIRFDTVQFLYPDPMVEFGQTATLKRLADATGGSYRFVSERKLGLR